MTMSLSSMCRYTKRCSAEESVEKNSRSPGAVSPCSYMCMCMCMCMCLNSAFSPGGRPPFTRAHSTGQPMRWLPLRGVEAEAAAAIRSLPPQRSSARCERSQINGSAVVRKRSKCAICSLELRSPRDAGLGAAAACAALSPRIRVPSVLYAADASRAYNAVQPRFGSCALAPSTSRCVSARGHERSMRSRHDTVCIERTCESKRGASASAWLTHWLHAGLQLDRHAREMSRAVSVLMLIASRLHDAGACRRAKPSCSKDCPIGAEEA